MWLSYRNLAPPSQAIRSTNKSVSNLIRFCSGMHDHLRELVLLQSHERQGLLRLDLKSTIFHTDPILLSFPVLGPPENLTLVNVKHLSRNTSKAVVTWWPPHNIFSTDHIQEYRLTWRKIPILVGQMSEPHSDSTKLPPVSKNPVWNLRETSKWPAVLAENSRRGYHQVKFWIGSREPQDQVTSSVKVSFRRLISFRKAANCYEGDRLFQELFCRKFAHTMPANWNQYFEVALSILRRSGFVVINIKVN